jgi:hypothetical protein
MADADRKRIENAVETLYDLANIGTTFFDAIEALKTAGYTAEEIKAAMQMYLWNQHRMH